MNSMLTAWAYIYAGAIVVGFLGAFVVNLWVRDKEESKRA